MEVMLWFFICILILIVLCLSIKIHLMQKAAMEISNALKYSDGDLSISLSEKGEILFSNHASHLNELHAMQLFNRYYTVESAENSTGLGLSIAKDLTEKMNGEITASWKNGIFCIFIFFPDNKPAVIPYGFCPASITSQSLRRH